MSRNDKGTHMLTRTMLLGCSVGSMVLASQSDAALTFLTQNRFAEVYTTPTYNLNPLRLSAPTLSGISLHPRRHSSDATGDGFGEVHQISTVSDRPTVYGDATATALGTGAGHAQSFYRMTFTSDTDSEFFFHFNAAAFSASVVSHFHMLLSGDGVSFASDSATTTLPMGGAYELTGSGTFLAGKSYAIEIDFVVEATGQSAPGGGNFSFALVPTPSTALAMGLALVPTSRRRR